MAAEFDLVCVCDSLSQLYETTRPDLVVVSVSEVSTRKICAECFGFPWTVLMEKPPGIHRIEAESILDSAQSHGRRALVGLNRRFYSSTRAAIKSLDEHEGKRFIHIQDQQNLTTGPGPGYTQDVIDNWMFANSIHVVDLLRVFGRGDVVSVNPILPWTGPETDVMLAEVKFSSGDFGLYEGIWKGPGPWSVSVTVPEIRWEMRPLEQAAFQLDGSRTLEDAPLHAWDMQFKPGFRAQAEMAVAAGLGQPSGSTTLADAVETMRLIERIYVTSGP